MSTQDNIPNILFEGRYPTTPDIFLDVLHDYWLTNARSLEGTILDGMQFTLEKFDNYRYSIYIKKGWNIFNMFACIDIRRLEDQLLLVTIPSTKTRGKTFEGKPWNEISEPADKFLLDFVKHLRHLFPIETSRRSAKKAKHRNKEPINLQTKSAGRHVDPWNPEAWRMIIEGGGCKEAWIKAFTYWCNQKGINPETASKDDRRAFKKAMARQKG